MITNLVMIVILVGAIVTTLYLFLRHDTVIFTEDLAEDEFSLEKLTLGVRDTFDAILKTNVAELNLNRYETQKSERKKAKLRKALKICSYGNIESKDFIKEWIKDLLQKNFKVTEFSINRIIHFQEVEALSPQDKFEILLHVYKRKYGYDGLSELINQNELDRPIGRGSEIHYKINKSDIDACFQLHAKLVESLEFSDKLAIVAQRIYQSYKGHGVIDELRDMKIDGINCGTSGIPNTFYTYGANLYDGIKNGELPLASYNAVWLMFHGKQIHLSFLGFQRQLELERVCKNIYRYGNPGTLSAARGYIASEMQDGSRVVVARPPFSESWALFVRKFDVANKMALTNLISDKGNEKTIECMKWLLKGCRNVAITGAQAVGKSTLMMSLIQFINQTFTIRVQELTFELNLRKIYPKRNILSFRETDSVTGQEGLNIQKKTDGSVNILGEVASAEVASWAIQMGQVGSNQTIFTHHAKTAKDLVRSFRNNMIEAAGYNNEKVVEELVANVLNFDIHLSKDAQGHRYDM